MVGSIKGVSAPVAPPLYPLKRHRDSSIRTDMRSGNSQCEGSRLRVRLTSRTASAPDAHQLGTGRRRCRTAWLKEALSNASRQGRGGPPKKGQLVEGCCERGQQGRWMPVELACRAGQSRRANRRAQPHSPSWPRLKRRPLLLCLWLTKRRLQAQENCCPAKATGDGRGPWALAIAAGRGQTSRRAGCRAAIKQPAVR
jgi:hypothetical protein